MKPQLAINFCATNMLTRQCLRHIQRLAIDRFYRDRAFVASSDFYQTGDVEVRPALARQFRWRRGTDEGSRTLLWIDRRHVWRFYTILEKGKEVHSLRDLFAQRVSSAASAGTLRTSSLRGKCTPSGMNQPLGNWRSSRWSLAMTSGSVRAWA